MPDIKIVQPYAQIVFTFLKFCTRAQTDVWGVCMRLFCPKDGRDKNSWIADAQLHVARSIEKCRLPFAHSASGLLGVWACARLRFVRIILCSLCHHIDNELHCICCLTRITTFSFLRVWPWLPPMLMRSCGCAIIWMDFLSVFVWCHCSKHVVLPVRLQI